MAPLHRFEIKSSYGPAELFAALRGACDTPAARKANAHFDFDWMKRGVWIQADGADNLAAITARVSAAVDKGAGTGQLLVGKVEELTPGRFRQAIGVLLQTPDVYTEVMGQALTEFGILGILISADRNSIEVPSTKVNKGQNYVDMVTGFPLPSYLSVEDQGIQP